MVESELLEDWRAKALAAWRATRIAECPGHEWELTIEHPALRCAHCPETRPVRRG